MDFKIVDDLKDTVVKKGKMKGLLPFIVVGAGAGLFIFMRNKSRPKEVLLEDDNISGGLGEVRDDMQQQAIQKLEYENNLRFTDLEENLTGAFNQIQENLFLNNQNISTQLLDFQSEYRTDLTTVANNVDNMKYSIQNDVSKQIASQKENFVVNTPSETIQAVINTPSETIQAVINTTVKSTPSTPARKEPTSLIGQSKENIPSIMSSNKEIRTENVSQALKNLTKVYLAGGDVEKARKEVNDVKRANFVDDRPIVVLPRK
jgi:hypothetical protein